MASEADSEGSWLQRVLHGTLPNLFRPYIPLMASAEAKEAASQNGSDLAEVGIALSEGLWTNDNVVPERYVLYRLICLQSND